MYRYASLFLLLFVAAAGCDSNDPQDDQNPPTGNVDDGSVTLADVYTADMSGTEASFFRANEPGVCATAIVTLRFDIEEFSLSCTIVAEGQDDISYNPDGTFDYVLDDGRLTVTPSFNYTLTGVARDGGERIDASIQRGNGRSIDTVLLAQD